jgi:hypothetical protein
VVQAAAVGGADSLGGVGFAHRQHGDSPGRTLAFFGGQSYSLEEFGDFGRNQSFIHGVNGSLFSAWQAIAG